MDVGGTKIAAGQQELAGIDDRVAATQQALGKAGLSFTDKILLQINLGLAEQRRTTVTEDVATRQQLLAQANEVEKARIVEPAVARKVTAQNRRNQLIVGGALGLLVGLAAALLWDPLARRIRPAR